MLAKEGVLLAPPFIFSILQNALDTAKNLFFILPPTFIVGNLPLRWGFYLSMYCVIRPEMIVQWHLFFSFFLGFNVIGRYCEADLYLS